MMHLIGLNFTFNIDWICSLAKEDWPNPSYPAFNLYLRLFPLLSFPTFIIGSYENVAVRNTKEKFLICSFLRQDLGLKIWVVSTLLPGQSTHVLFLLRNTIKNPSKGQHFKELPFNSLTIFYPMVILKIFSYWNNSLFDNVGHFLPIKISLKKNLNETKNLSICIVLW